MPDATKADNRSPWMPVLSKMELAPDFEVEVVAAGVAVADMEPVMEPDMVIEPDGAAVAAADGGRLASVVKDAERPVTFLQFDGIAVALPETKLRAAHFSR